MRQRKCTFTIEENEDFIPDMAIRDKFLICPSGDGFLSVYDIRKGVLEAMSDCMDDELLSIAIVKVIPLIIQTLSHN